MKTKLILIMVVASMLGSCKKHAVCECKSKENIYTTKPFIDYSKPDTMITKETRLHQLNGTDKKNFTNCESYESVLITQDSLLTFKTYTSCIIN